MKIAIAFCAHKRKDLTELCIEHLNNLKKDFDIEIVVCSTIGEKYDNCHNIEAKNYPLSQKHNTLFNHCKTLDIDGIILIGSDDFMSKERLQWYFDTCKKGGKTLVSIDNVHFFSTKTKELTFYTEPDPQIGGGRFFSKYVLDKCNWNPWGKLEINKSLDYNSGKYLLSLGIKARVLSPLGMFVGVHHGMNVSNEARLYMGDKIDNQVLVEELGEIGTKLLALERPTIEVPESFEGVRTIKTTAKNKFSQTGSVKELDAYSAYLLVSRGFAIYID